MNIKLKAALIVLGTVIVAATVATVAQFLPWYIFPAAMLAFLLYIMYQLILSKLEMDAKIDAMSKEYQK